MNERIRELEKQATDIVKCGLNGTATAESFNRKKFAELIVRECAEIADLADENKCEWIGGNILTHFGVK